LKRGLEVLIGPTQHLQGVARAQINLGIMYDTGLGVPQDYAEAVKWYRTAADQGRARAQNNLGVTYQILVQRGVEPETNLRLATQAFKEASAH